MTKEDIQKFVSDLLALKDHTVWVRFGTHFRLRLVQGGRLELESEIPGYDHAPPTVVSVADMAELAGFLLVLQKEIQKGVSPEAVQVGGVVK